MARRLFIINGAKVRELRERSGLDQPALAAKVGITQSYLSRIESGGRNPNPADTLKIAKALDVTFDDITERLADEVAS